MKYRSFWRSEFERLLSSLANQSNLLYWEEVSNKINNSDIETYEFVYKFKLKNKSVCILIFSSIDKKTDKTRDVGSDAIRMVYEWNTKNGLIYKRIAKRNRVENSFNNVRESLLNASENCFNLKGREFGCIENALK